VAPDHVGRGGAAAEGPVVALDLKLERDLALRDLAGGDATGGEFAEVDRDPSDALDPLEDRVDRAVADRGVLDQDPIGAADRDRGRRVQGFEPRVRVTSRMDFSTRTARSTS
jgi:hypothetical protein